MSWEFGKQLIPMTSWNLCTKSFLKPSWLYPWKLFLVTPFIDLCKPFNKNVVTMVLVIFSSSQQWSREVHQEPFTMPYPLFELAAQLRVSSDADKQEQRRVRSPVLSLVQSKKPIRQPRITLCAHRQIDHATVTVLVCTVGKRFFFSFIHSFQSI